MRTPILLLVLASALWSTTPVAARQASGFYRVEGTRILDPQGRQAVIRGMGLGGWLMPEGYMLKMGGGWTSMKQKVLQVVPPTVADQVWARYRKNYVAERDIAALSSWGFDHIRLPFHYEVFYDLSTRQFVPDGFVLLDEFLGWCARYGLPVILDLHAAPGGQSDGAIADADGEAKLWTQPDPYQGMTIEIWEEIARRYKDDTRIIGYDLLNEPVTPNSVSNGAAALRAFYGKLVDAIRAIDSNHILFIEGNYYATTFDRLTPPFDSNMVYAFHKYWNATDVGTINYLLGIRDGYNVPLWLGETGENSNPWLRATTRLAESNGFGWNFWTHKQLGSTVPPTTATLKPGFQRLLDYWNGGGPKPSSADAQAALFEMVDGLVMDSVRVNGDVLEALFSPVFDTQHHSWSQHHLPGVLDAVKYDIGNQGVAYHDTDYWAISGAPGGGNTGGQYRNDGVDIEKSSDPYGFEYNVGWLNPGEWMKYTVIVDETGEYDVEFRVASQPGGGELVLTVDGVEAGRLDVPATGGWQTWSSEWIRGLPLVAGTHVLKIGVARAGDFNLNRATFHLAGDGPDESVPLSVAVFPQPVSGQATFRLSGGQQDTRVQVYDLMGRRVADRTFSSGVEIRYDVSGLVSGLYLYQIMSGDQRASGRLMVTR